MGFVWGTLSGDMQTALALAVFYELFWLDLFAAGTYVPPNALFPLFIVLMLASAQSAPDAGTLVGPVILTLPLAYLGSYMEERHRVWQVAGYNRVLGQYRAGASPGRAAAGSVRLSLVQLFVLNFCVFFAVACLCLMAADILVVWQKKIPAITGATWPMLWTLGAVGGLLALRIRRAYLTFAVSCVAAAIAVSFI